MSESNDQSVVEHYRLMADASRRMLNAAREDDWERVCAIEKECAALIGRLSAMGDLAPADPTLRQQKIDLVKRVLADDAEIRLLSQPWLRKLDALMRGPDSAAGFGGACGSGLLPG